MKKQNLDARRGFLKAAAGASLTAMTFDRATTAHMEPPGTPGTLRATPASGPDTFFQR